MRAHQRENEEVVLSIDLMRHHDDDGILSQRDILDELLEDVAPLPEPPPPTPRVASPTSEVDLPPRTPSPGTAENAFGLVTVEAQRAVTPLGKLPERCRRTHTIVTDMLIYKFVEVHGPRWRKLARSLGGRDHGYSDDVVRNRYIRIMDAMGTPYETQRVRTKTPRKPAFPVEVWTDAEDALIVTGVSTYGSKWAMIADYFQGARTPQAVRNRANRIGAAPAFRAGERP